MSKIEKLYHWLTLQPDLEAAVAGLTTRGLQELAGFLARAGAVSGIPSLIQGLIYHEAAERLLKQRGRNIS